MITYKQVGKECLGQYDAVPMLVHVTSHFVLDKLDRGLGGFLIKEIPVEPYTKDYGVYERAADYEKRFDVTHWAFFMAFDGDNPVGAATVVSRTPEVNMLEGRDDLAVLWDIRVDDAYKRQGIGQRLFDMAADWARSEGFRQLKIECQNINVNAVRFYHKQGAVLCSFNEYAYREPDCRHEIQFLWYLDL